MSIILENIYTKRSLIIGDILVIVLITILGFATHREIGNLYRMLTTFVPLCAAWFLISPFFGLFDEKLINQASQLWRIVWAMFGVVPFAAWMRGLWLNTTIVPIFVLVLGGVSILGMLLWRILYFVINMRLRVSNG